jgi:hypothetical protein
VNTYQVTYFPEGWNPAAAPLGCMQTVTAAEFLIDAEYVIFVDDATPPKAVFAIPHSAIPVILRTAVGT